MNNKNLQALIDLLSIDTDTLKRALDFNSLDFGFVDNGASVLAVVHVDTVFNAKMHFKIPQIQPQSCGDTLINHVNLDDRLGLWLLLYELPERYPDIRYDILFTTDEEVGMSTAEQFISDKKYNWIFQFDRRGFGNVVMYEYETREAVVLLENYGYDVQVGTFSDICKLEHLGCKGFNFGCGYVDEHTNKCRTRLSWIDVVCEMFADFYVENKDTHMPHTKAPYSFRTKYFGANYSSSSWLKNYPPEIDDDEIEPRLCNWCDRMLLSNEHEICDFCEREARSLGWAKCTACRTLFSVDDLEDGMCYDCR